MTAPLPFPRRGAGFIALIRRIRIPIPRWAELVPPCAIGSVAMFWILQRVAAF